MAARCTAARRACTVGCAAGGVLVLMLLLAAPFGSRQTEDMSMGAVRQAEALTQDEVALNAHIHSNLQLLEALSHTLRSVKLRAAYRIAARARSRHGAAELDSRRSSWSSSSREASRPGHGVQAHPTHGASTAPRRGNQAPWTRSEWSILDSNRDLTGVHLSVSRPERHQQSVFVAAQVADPLQMPFALRTATSAWKPPLRTRYISGPDALRQVSPAAAIAMGEAAAHGLAAGGVIVQ